MIATRATTQEGSLLDPPEAWRKREGFQPARRGERRHALTHSDRTPPASSGQVISAARIAGVVSPVRTRPSLTARQCGGRTLHGSSCMRCAPCFSCVFASSHSAVVTSMVKKRANQKRSVAMKGNRECQEVQGAAAAA